MENNYHILFMQFDDFMEYIQNNNLNKFEQILKNHRNNMKSNLKDIINEHNIHIKNNNNNDTFIASILFDKELVGFGRLNYIHDKNEGYINMINVESSHRGKGLCKILMKKIIDEACKLKLNKLILEVDINNYSAIKCYESVGFTTIKEIKTDKYHEYLMELNLVQKGGMSNYELKYKYYKSKYLNLKYN